MLTATGTPSWSLRSFFQTLDVFTFAANHHPRACRKNGDARVFGWTLNLHARHRGVFEFLFQVLAHLDVFGQHARKIAVAGVPTAGPITRHRKAEAGGVDFLSHTGVTS